MKLHEHSIGRPRVAVTGVGLATPIGIGVEEYWKAAVAGKSGIQRISHFDPSGLPSQMAAAMRDEEKTEELQAWVGLGPEESRVALFGLATARMACDAARWDALYRSDRVGVFFGTTGERLELRRMADVAYRSRANNGGQIDASAYVREYCSSFTGQSILRLFPQYVTARIASRYRITGPSCTIQTACTSSAQAIGEGLRAIQRGAVDAAIVGGSEFIVSPIEVQIFCLLGALSRRNNDPERASRPFDAQRDGFVLGEGAGVMVLERLDKALERGAPLLAELAGYGTSCDAYRLTDEPPDGRGAVLAMRRALEDAGLAPDAVDYINAHGTSTLMNDKVETAAIRTVFGQRAYEIPVSSTKSMIGHTISAAGAIELITCVLALRDQVVPPTINYEYPDPECDLDYVSNRARPACVRSALSNSFGFGGHNDCLIVKRLTEREPS